jgi:PKD repeat protein
LKKKEDNISTRELFRKKLGNAEVIPGITVKSQLMRKVARKEFLRFNPARLNIYYLGSILIAGVTAALLLISPAGNSDQTMSSGKPDKLNTDTNNFLIIPVEKPVRYESGRSGIIRNKQPDNSFNEKKPDKSLVTPTGTPEEKKPSVAFPPVIRNSASKNNITVGNPTDKRKLQAGSQHIESLIDPSVSVGCAPLKVWFHSKSDLTDSCRWTFGDGGYSSNHDPEWIFDVEGEYNIVLQIFSHDGKHYSSTAKVTVHPRPQAHFEISPENAVIPNDEIIFQNFSKNAVQFKWDFGDGFSSEFFEPRHKYEKFGNYNIRLVVLSDWGCSDTLTVLNAFSGSKYFIDFPNAFIPNEQGSSAGYYSFKSDEAAQVFHPSYSGVSDFHLKIFSRLGIQIFESSDINIGWDGYNKGQLCDPGVYIWKVRGKFRNGEPFIKMGDVTLLKN